MGRLKLPPLMRFPVQEHPWGRLNPAEVVPLASVARKRLGMPPADEDDRWRAELAAAALADALAAAKPKQKRRRRSATQAIEAVGHG